MTSVCLIGCREKPQPPLRVLAPAPLPSIAAAAVQSETGPAKAEAPVWGMPAPKNATLIALKVGKVQWGPALLDMENADQLQTLKDGLPLASTVLLVPDGETYLAQVSALWATLDDIKAHTWIQHPSGSVAFPVELYDEPAFRRWLDEPKPGKIRIIQRADGFELQTNIGKLPGNDLNGPTVPTRGGQLDIAGVRSGLMQLLKRFPDTRESCLVPSFGTPLAKIAVALSGYYQGPGEPIFSEVCLVYPRPVGVALRRVPNR